MAVYEERVKLIMDINDAKARVKEIDKAIKTWKGSVSTKTEMKLDLAKAQQSVKDLTANMKKYDAAQKEAAKSTKFSMLNIFAAVNIAKNAYRALANTVGAWITKSNLQEDELRKTKFLFQENTDSMIALSKEIQLNTRYGDEQALSMMNLAKSMGASDENIEKLTKGSIGLSTALGVDATAAMRYLTLAMEEGDYSMLNRYLPTLRALETETEKEAELNKILSQSYGLAKDSALGGAGAIDQMKNKLGDLQEKLGTLIKRALVPLIPMFKGLVKVAEGFISLAMPDEFKDVSDNVEDSFNNVVKLRRELKGLSEDQIEKKIAEIEAELTKISESSKTYAEDLINQTKAQEENNKITLNGTDTFNKYNKTQEETIDLTAKNTTETDTYTGSNNLLEKQTVATGKATFNYVKELQKLKDDLQKIKDGTDDAKDSTEEFIEPMMDLSNLLKKFSEEFIEPDMDVSFFLKPKEAAEEAKASFEDYAETFNSLMTVGTELSNLQTTQIDADYKKQAKAWDDKLKAGTISKIKYDEEIAKLDLKAEAEKKKILERQKIFDIGTAIANTAVAVTKAYELPFPLNWIQGIAVGAAGALQVATIKAQEFAQGGIPGEVLSNNPNENLVIRDRATGQAVGTMGSTEGIINSETMADPFLRSVVSAANVAGGGVGFKGAQPLQSLAGGGGESNVNITVNNTFDENGITTMVTKNQNDYTRSGGNNDDL